MTRIFCGIYWHHGLRAAFCPIPHRSAQSPHRCTQVRTGPQVRLGGARVRKKTAPEVPKSPKPNRTGCNTHPHSFIHTPSGGWTFSRKLGPLLLLLLLLAAACSKPSKWSTASLRWLGVSDVRSRSCLSIAALSTACAFMIEHKFVG